MNNDKAQKWDITKELKEVYLPKAKPVIVTVPPIKYLAVSGKGNPNDEDGEFSKAMSILYGITFTVKMSIKSGTQPKGYFEYSVPPLEGLWRMQGGRAGMDYQHKELMEWTVMLAQPSFVTDEVLEWAKAEVLRKKGTDASIAKLFTYDEGLCVECMHSGTYDDEPATVEKLHAAAKEAGAIIDYESERRHHEIYIKNPQRTLPENLRTVIRLPIIR